MGFYIFARFCIRKVSRKSVGNLCIPNSEYSAKTFEAHIRVLGANGAFVIIPRHSVHEVGEKCRHTNNGKNRCCRSFEVGKRIIHVNFFLLFYI